MTENKCKSLENLLPRQSPVHFEIYRNELHREMAKHWPVRINRSESTTMAPAASKSTAHSSIRDGNGTLYQTFSNLPLKNFSGPNSARVSEKKAKIKKRIIPMESEFSLTETQQRNEWNVKAQEGVISHALPDGLPDGSALYNKLQKLMSTDTIYLNDRRFWTKLENQFKKLRKHSLQENMARLRQTQEKYERELISKGIMPYTTEEAIKQYAEQPQLKTDKIDPINAHRKNCLIADLSSPQTAINPMPTNDELDAFESDNVHPCLDELLTDYQFQTKSGKELGEKFQKDLHQSQIQIKTIFPKTNRRDSIRQELEAVRTSEGLYAYSNRLPKRISK